MFRENPPICAALIPQNLKTHLKNYFGPLLHTNFRKKTSVPDFAILWGHCGHIDIKSGFNRSSGEFHKYGGVGTLKPKCGLQI